MKMKTKYLQVLIPILTCYMAGYTYFRLASDIVRIQNKANGQRNQIMARANAWNDLDVEMTRNSNTISLKTVAKLQKIKEPTLRLPDLDIELSKN